MSQPATPHSSSSPALSVSSIMHNGLLFLSASFMLLCLFLVFCWVPTEQNLGVSQRIFYVHVPMAWLGMVSIVVVAISSAIHLITSKEKWDSFAYANAELGVTFITLLLVTGIVWTKVTWGVWWTWDARLTTTAILWFIFVGYLMLRAYGPKGSQGARYGAVVALIGAIDTPIIYMATVWWRTVHPEMNVGPLSEEGSLDSSMLITLMISTIAFTFLYVWIMIERYSLRRSEIAIDELYQKIS
ncbi:MAG: cytochrome c biogenesis protein CcsA [SAR202 cluster bacterium]|nr:cytochrome c biogenesis protein CcsA [SAR202 cluster bacterium]